MLRRRDALTAVCLGVAGLRAGWASSEASIRLVIVDNVYRDLLAFAAGRDLLKIDEFGGPASRRDLVEPLLLLQALALGGVNRSPQFLPLPNSSRMLHELAARQGDCSATTVWRDDATGFGGQLRLSDSLIGESGVNVGLYMLPAKAKALAGVPASEVRRLRVVSNRNWRVDWATLEALGFELQHAPNWEAMLRMVAASRVDAVLTAFRPTPNMELVTETVRLLPLAGYKVALRGSRHFAVAEAAAQADELLAGLNKGLARLHDMGTVRRALQQCGLFHAEVVGWQTLASKRVLSEARQ